MDAKHSTTAFQVLWKGKTYNLSFQPGLKLSEIKAQICSSIVSDDPASDYILVLNEDETLVSNCCKLVLQARKFNVLDVDDSASDWSESDDTSPAPSSGSVVPSSPSAGSPLPVVRVESSDSMPAAGALPSSSSSSSSSQPVPKPKPSDKPPAPPEPTSNSGSMVVHPSDSPTAKPQAPHAREGSPSPAGSVLNPLPLTGVMERDEKVLTFRRQVSERGRGSGSDLSASRSRDDLASLTGHNATHSASALSPHPHLRGHERHASLGVMPSTSGGGLGTAGRKRGEQQAKDLIPQNIERPIWDFPTTATDGSFVCEELSYDDPLPAGGAAPEPAFAPVPTLDASDDAELVLVKEDDGRQLVVGGSLDRLIHLLTHKTAAADRDFIRDFLYSYRYFCTSAQLLDALRKTWDGCAKIADEKEQRGIRARVVNVLRLWLDNHYYYFAKDDALIEAVNDFINTQVAVHPEPAYNRWVDVLRDTLLRRGAMAKPPNPQLLEAIATAMQNPKTGVLGPKKGKGNVTGQEVVEWLMSTRKTRSEAIVTATHMLGHFLWPLPGKTPAEQSHCAPNAPFKDSSLAQYTLTKPKNADDDDSLPKSKLLEKFKDAKAVSLLKMHPTELARQLTLLEHEMLRRISPMEILNSAWKKASKQESSPHVCEAIQWFNRVNAWVQSEVVMTPNLRQRAAVVTRFINTAERLRKIGNYQGVMEIVAALQNTAIQNLKKTWKEVSEKDVQAWQELSKLMDINDNYKHYREELAQRDRVRDQPVLPYIGVFLQDFLIVEEVTDKLGNGTLNFQKARRVSNMLLRLRRFQSVHFHFRPIAPIHEYLQTGLSVLSDADIYKWAKFCEAGKGAPGKDPKDDKKDKDEKKDEKKDIK